MCDKLLTFYQSSQYCANELSVKALLLSVDLLLRNFEILNFILTRCLNATFTVLWFGFVDGSSKFFRARID